MFSERKALTTALSDYYRTVATRIERFQKVRKKADLYEATRFSAFDYIDRDENRLSDVIHDLLDPSGRHGQGTLFLYLFLEAIGVAPESVHPPFRVKREDCTLYCASFQRRIDITLELGDFGVGIENKPWASEGQEQLKDYCLHLRQKYAQRFMLVYLSGDGSRPTSINRTDLAALQAAKQFKSLAFPTGLHRWLERCSHGCKADKVRWFLSDFAEYVKKGFELIDADEEPIHEAQ
jgi:hypothetical protein